AWPGGFWFSTQPANARSFPGGPAKFGVGVSAEWPHVITYQWQHSSDQLNWADLPTAISSEYTIQSVTPADVGSYRVVVTRDCYVQASNPATLSLLPLPQLTGIGRT